MDSTDEQILRASKEIVVKFIETGRIFPTGFHDAFIGIYSAVEEAVKGQRRSIESSGPSIGESSGKSPGKSPTD
jgi:hypothetical protein